MTDTEQPRYVNGRLDMAHAPSLGAFIGKTLARFVSGNNQPVMSGDDRERIRLPHVRERYDRACDALAAEILAAQSATEQVGSANGDEPNNPTDADLFERLDAILVEESPMHPFGCATWEEATRVAIDMAKDEITRLRAITRAEASTPDTKGKG